jgi:hypothetical protein
MYLLEKGADPNLNSEDAYNTMLVKIEHKGPSAVDKVLLDEIKQTKLRKINDILRNYGFKREN